MPTLVLIDEAATAYRTTARMLISRREGRAARPDDMAPLAETLSRARKAQLTVGQV